MMTILKLERLLNLKKKKLELFYNNNLILILGKTKTRVKHIVKIFRFKVIKSI